MPVPKIQFISLSTLFVRTILSPVKYLKSSKRLNLKNAIKKTLPIFPQIFEFLSVGFFLYVLDKKCLNKKCSSVFYQHCLLEPFFDSINGYRVICVALEKLAKIKPRTVASPISCIITRFAIIQAKVRVRFICNSIGDNLTFALEAVPPIAWIARTLKAAHRVCTMSKHIARPVLALVLVLEE